MQISSCILVFVLSVIVCSAQDHIDLDYKYGTEYQYEYTVGIVADEKSSQQFEPSTVNYTCQFSMKLFNGTGFLKITKAEVEDNFNVIDSDPESNDFTNYYLKFDMLPDGKVSKLYPDSRESNWVLNFKRGLLSMFTSDEEDVHGKCTTRVSVEKQDDGDIWKREKQTFYCKKSFQPNSKFAVGSVRFQFRKYMEYSLDNWYYDNKKFQEHKRGQQVCEGLVSDKVFQSINCSQAFKFNIGFGSVAFVDQGLTLLNSEAQSANFEDFYKSLDFKPVTDAKSLMYEAEDTLAPLNSKHHFKISKSLLSDLCKDDFKRSSIDFIQKYIELVQAFSALSYEQLEALEKSSTCEFSNNIFLKALSDTRSFNSTLMMMDKIIKMQVPSRTEDQWLTQMSLEEYINKAILDKAYELLQKRPGEYSVAMSVASMAHTYCEQYWYVCTDHTQKFKKEFEDSLKYNYEHYGENSNSADYLYIAIRIVKSLAYSTKSDLGILKTILEDQKVKPFVRAAVLDVYPNTANFDKEDLMKIFENSKEPVELRIAVYMKLYSRLERYFLPNIYKLLKEESSNQVTHYIWTHLMYKLEENYTSNAEIAEFIKCEYSDCTVLLDNVTHYSMTDLVNELIISPELKVPKESEADEFSYYAEGDFSYQTNFTSNMIFTPASFLPSHFEFKLKPRRLNRAHLDVFKMFVNMEGFDDYFLSIFELEGRSITKKLEEQKNRNRRNAKREYGNEPGLSFGVDVLGKHYMYEFFYGDTDLKEFLSAINTLDKINVTMNGPNSNYNEASIVVDHVESFPTAAGFPVRYDLKAAFMRNLTIIGKVESENFKKSRELHFNGLFEQFYGLGITRHLSIDTYQTESITKLEGFAMVKPKFHAKLDVEGFNHIHLDIGLVEDEDMHIAHVKAEHYPGSRFNETARAIKIKNYCDEDGENEVSIQVCYPRDAFYHLQDLEYMDMPFTLKKMHKAGSDANVTVHWDKIEDGRYALNVSVPYRRFSESKYFNFHTENGNFSMTVDELDADDEMETVPVFWAKYENSENAKYIKFSSRRGIPKIFMFLYGASPVSSILNSLF